MTRNRCAFSARVESLEGRLVLSHARHPLSVVVSTLAPSQLALNTAQLSIVAEVNQAFGSFKAEFDQARATYFASIQGQPSSPMATNAFMLYTTQRVELLSQQLMSSFLVAPNSPLRVRGTQDPIKQLIASKIIGNPMQAPEGSLARSLYETMPVPGASAPSESLYSLSQDLAIETARDTVLNDLAIFKVGAYGNSLGRPSH